MIDLTILVDTTDAKPAKTNLYKKLSFRHYLS
jgi:hypothetical protein